MDITRKSDTWFGVRFVPVNEDHGLSLKPDLPEVINRQSLDPKVTLPVERTEVRRVRQPETDEPSGTIDEETVRQAAGSAIENSDDLARALMAEQDPSDEFAVLEIEPDSVRPPIYLDDEDPIAGDPLDQELRAALKADEQKD